MQEHLQSLLEARIDFEGQRLVGQIVQLSLVAITIISFLLGFALQSLRVTFVTFGLSTAVLAVVVLPPWPMYNRHPVQFLPPKENKVKEGSRDTLAVPS
ncbi:SPC12-domain-containing protein [Wolfiporia cocos MD-104 SS10]|uniref:Signal peptidase complex subunit 1 n=1 Tax=Wolfiporia cocos (strain MD-104) TaxID=742152 RepID=A0A2H3JAY3_WOLCO|nr:SPC12-domain-containing protein [Wolfiporia cocos MD-104 SS10]